MSRPCPSCGARTEGKFCSECGTALGARQCHSCGAEVKAGGRFCTACGTAVMSAGKDSRPAFPLVPTLVAGVAVLGLVMVLIFRQEPPAQPLVQAPFAASTPGGGLPDLSTMTPREQFDRLYNRVMAAAEQGDTTTVTSFSPMALQAYGNLETVDADARYHAAMLHLHGGTVAAARALADSILAEEPSHLFGFVIRSAVSAFGGDGPAGEEANTKFLEAWESEMTSGKSEYEDHRQMLEAFERSARGAVRMGN